MILNEIFDKDIKYQVISNTERRFVTSAEIGKRTITFQAGCTQPYHGDTHWNVAFFERTESGMTYMATGNGNEIEVFNMVIRSLKDLIKIKRPDHIHFTASKSEEIGTKRAMLYIRMLMRYAPSDYIASAEDTDIHHSFTLSRRDLDDKQAA